MNKNARLLIIASYLLIFVGLYTVSAQTIAINEVMASNATTIADEDGDFEDWIELYNYGDVSVNLDGFGLSDNYDMPFKWVLPDISLSPGEFLLIWASGKNRNDPESPLHTNYSISAAGEEVILTHPDGTIIDELVPTNIPTDISYGRYPDGTGSWFYFIDPTPNAANDTDTFAEILEPPTFSHSGGFYNDPFDLIITHPDPDVTIIYTLDGSIPDIDNLDGTSYPYKNSYPEAPGQAFGDTLYSSFQSLVYDSGIYIYDRSSEPDKLTQMSSTHHQQPGYFPESPVHKSFIVRAKAIKPGSLQSPAKTHTFFVGENPYTLPVISISVQEDALFDYYNGIYTAGVDFDTWRINNPGGSEEIGWRFGNYYRRGDEAEFPMHLELFEKNSTLGFSQNLGVRIHGGDSRANPMKGLRLYSRSMYDVNNTMQYRFFPDEAYHPGGILEEYNRLILRMGGNAQNLIRDATCHRLMEAASVDIQKVRPVIKFINGEFWGMAHIRDRLDEHYLHYKYQISTDNVVIINGPRWEGNINTIEAGYPEDILLYRNMYNFVINNDMSNPENLTQVGEMLDFTSFVDYNLMFIYLNNFSWYGWRHFRYWRVRETSEAPWQDGKWRMMVWDFDWTPNTSDFDYLNTVLTDSSWDFLQNLLDNIDFKHFFINRFADHINSTFIPDRIESTVTDLFNTLQPEVENVFNRWKTNMGVSEFWKNRWIDFAQERPFYQRNYIREHFDIESDIDITLDVNDTQTGYIRINTIAITPETPGVAQEPYPWTGIYFHNIPIEVEAIAHEGYAFSHWEGVENGEEALLQITPTDDISLIAHFTETEYAEPELLYFWVFDGSIPNNTPLEYLEATFEIPGEGVINYHSALEGYPFDPEHPNWRKASMERRNAPTDINYRPEGNNGTPYANTGMRGMQVKQPFTGDAGENTLFFQMPTTGYKDIQFKFAAKDEGAADALIIDYSIASGEPEWIIDGLEETILPLFGDFLLYEVDFTSIDAANNNPDFIVRMRFEGDDMAADDEHRVTFNNISLDGVPAFAPLVYYSKPEGDLNNPSTWGSEADGSGTMPPDFVADNTTYIIQNRETTTLDESWTVSGIGSMVALGDGSNPINLVLNNWLNAAISISNNATLTLNTTDYPEITEAETGSTIVFTGDAHLIPYLSYHHLIIDNINPHFNGDGIVIIHGNLDITGNVVMPDARDSDNRYDLLFAGDHDQVIATNGNVLRAYDLDFVKNNGSIAFAENSIISSDNQLSFFFGEDALFEDNGIVIYAGNSVNIAGAGDAYDFTGTLILAGTEEGIVKGSGAGNNFNIREGDNENTVAALNNIIIRVENTGGQFRFRDGSTDMFTIKGDLIVEAIADGRIRLYDNEVFIGGDLIIEEGFSGSVDPLLALHLDGSEEQHLQLALPLETDRFYIDNAASLIHLDGHINVNELLVFTDGVLQIAEDGLLRISEGGQMVGAGGNSFVDGTFGHYVEDIGNIQLEFPIGSEESYLPLWLDFVSTVDDEVLYTAKVEPFEDDAYELPDDLDHLLEDYMYFLNASEVSSMTDAMISLRFDETDMLFDPELLRIAKLVDNTWVNMGGILNANTISSEEHFILPAVFALAKAVDELEVPETISLQNITIPAGTDDCFGATQSILLGGDGTSFVIEPGASVALTAGQNIIMQNHTHIMAGSYLHAHIAPEGPFCGIVPDHFLMADLIGDVIKDEALPAGDAIDADPDGEFAFTAYPNPTTGLLHIELRGIATDTAAGVDIFNMMGEHLLHKTTSDTHLTVDVLASSPAGIYMVRITHNKEVAYERVVKR